MKIPDIQARLRAKAADHRDPELAVLAAELSRRPPVTRAPRRSHKMTPELRAAIHALHRTHPGLSQQAIATRLGINAGRVSEVLAGFRE